jgi:general secretion pathway protein B
MSYILEALKKVEQQREIGRVPGIGSDHEHTSGRVSGPWLWLIVAVLLLNAGLLVTMLWPEPEPDPVVARTAMEPVEINRQEAPPASAPRVHPVERPVPPAQAVTPRAKAPVLTEPVETEPVVAPEVEQQVVTTPVSRKTPDIIQPPSTAPKTTVPALPVWPQIPSHLLQQLNGSLRLDVHVYSDRPQERFVLVNLQKYHEGEELQEGPLLDEITPEGVILSFRGQQFRVQAQ